MKEKGQRGPDLDSIMNDGAESSNMNTPIPQNRRSPPIENGPLASHSQEPRSLPVDIFQLLSYEQMGMGPISRILFVLPRGPVVASKIARIITRTHPWITKASFEVQSRTMGYAHYILTFVVI